MHSAGGLRGRTRSERELLHATLGRNAGTQQQCRRDTMEEVGSSVDSGRGTVVVAEQPTETLAASDSACVSQVARRIPVDELAVKALVGSFGMVVHQILPEHTSNLAFVQQDQSVQGLGLHG